MPKVSILVPIFRVEKYLRQCVDSILAQTLRDIEIILINDGSDDACPQICDEYAAADSRVKVIHKENSGYGASMNRGLKEATGDYIGIVESDDWVEPDMFEELYALATEHGVNVVRSNFFEYTDKEGDKLVELVPADECNHVIDPRVEMGVFYSMPAIWSCLYKRSFLTEAGIDFLESLGASYQDTAFNLKVWHMADRAWVTQKAYLHYRCDHAGSSVKSQSKVFCVADEWHEVERYLRQYPEREKASYILRSHLKYGTYKWNLERLEGEAREQFRALFSKEFKEILRNKGLCMEWVSAEDRDGLMKVIYPTRWEYNLHRWGHKIARVFFKSKIKNGKRKYRLLGGLIRLNGKAATPIWNEVQP